jgi:hypothetical protein
MPFRFVASALKGNLREAFRGFYAPISKAATLAMRETEAEVKTGARNAIAAAGFGRKWQNAFRTNFFPKRGFSASPAILAYHRIIYAGVFERGVVIGGHPLLWIPISGTPARIGSKKFTPKNYQELIGPLHFINVPGKAPMLAGYVAAKRAPKRISVAKLRQGHAAKAGKGDGVVYRSIPLFVGVSQVKLSAKFHLQDVFSKASANIAPRYAKFIKAE